MKVVATDTKGLLALAEDSSERNRTIYPSQLKEVVAEAGIHVLGFQMEHNGAELRTLWLVKLQDSNLPQELMLDVSFEAFEANAWLFDSENELLNAINSGGIRPSIH